MRCIAITMKFAKTVIVVGLGLACGCASEPVQIHPDPVASAAVVVGKTRTLQQAVIVAATRRRWTPNVVSDNVVRCTLIQRQHKVEIDVLLESATTYSITCVSCNIPEAKYRQWIGNLQREIAVQAAR